MRMKAMRLDTKKQISKAALVIFRVWARPRHCANPTVQIKLSLKKNDQGENLSHSKFGRKTEKETHKQRYNLVQKSQAEIQMWKKFYHLCESSVTLCWTCSLQIKVSLKQREIMQKSINEEGMVLRSRGCTLKTKNMFSYFCCKSKLTNSFASAVRCTNFEPQLCKDTDCKEHEEALRDTFSNYWFCACVYS